MTTTHTHHQQPPPLHHQPYSQPPPPAPGPPIIAGPVRGHSYPAPLLDQPPNTNPNILAPYESPSLPPIPSGHAFPPQNPNIMPRYPSPNSLTPEPPRSQHRGHQRSYSEGYVPYQQTGYQESYAAPSRGRHYSEDGVNMAVQRYQGQQEYYQGQQGHYEGYERPEQYEGHHHHHSHGHHHHHHEKDPYKTYGGESGVERPTVGDSLAMAWDTLKKVVTGKRD